MRMYTSCIDMHFMFVHPGLKGRQHQQTLVMFDKYNLKLGCLNIAGNANVKCRNDDIIRMISRYDIFAVLESWLDPEDACPVINGFANFRSERKKKCKAKRNSGGLIMWVILQFSGYSLSRTLADSDMTSISTLDPYMLFQLKHAFKIINWHACVGFRAFSCASMGVPSVCVISGLTKSG